MNRRGFALPLALAVMVATSILAVTALQVALADFQANRGARLADRALFAAEAGAQRTVATWTSGPFGALPPGDSASTGWVSLPDRSRYMSTVLRVDDGSSSATMYRVRTEGRPSRTSTARRQLVTMVTGTGSSSLCCRAAVGVWGELRIRAPNPPPRVRRRDWTPPAQSDGWDHVPIAWASYCAAAGPGVAGVHMPDEDDLDLERDALVAGSPLVEEDGSINRRLFEQLGGTTYAALASRADVRIADDRAYERALIRPSASGGVCTTSDSLNWGAPEAPGSACWGYLPIIHADDDLRLRGGGQGQGILLVDGDLRVERDFNFYGVVVVKGRVRWEDEATLTGGLIVGNLNREDDDEPRGESQIRDDGLIRYSSCAVARASGRTGSAGFLAGRHWFEIP